MFLVLTNRLVRSKQQDCNCFPSNCYYPNTTVYYLFPLQVSGLVNMYGGIFDYVIPLDIKLYCVSFFSLNFFFIPFDREASIYLSICLPIC